MDTMCGSLYREVECSAHPHRNTPVVSAVLFKMHTAAVLPIAFENEDWGWNTAKTQRGLEEREGERAQGPRRNGVIKASDLGIRAKGE
jgi:hypothetical protein